MFIYPLKCTQCDTTCSECNGVNAYDCTSCGAGRHLNTEASKYCCDNSCNTCSGTASTNCLTCNYNGDGTTFLNESSHTCGTTCATHYFKNTANYTVYLFFFKLL